ncbi:hypothetical protein F6R98_01025 [Candidatus Methylospira mobilis]|uniref:Polysaccharide chain length determinant N-terminal domain-containing protein n=1 Tax=Candidatus Methylospira mobilis TaxID=1808979 RepID=A0A5Q0BGX6_9GAMM|nr:hypothetical protein [Candidatus Methylospira mobilis]QFY41378.1 hypothetical protein F6R98_01025 [Candidatus Methylospira mobilis]
MSDLNNKIAKYVISALLGTLIGSVAYFVQPVRWEGQALIKVGSVLVKGSQKTTSITVGLENASIEEMQVVIERLKSPSFVQAVVKKLENEKAAELIYSKGDLGFKTRSIRNSDALVITLNGTSPALVRSALDAVVGELLYVHGNIFSEDVSSIQREITALESEIDMISRRLDTIINANAHKGENPDDEKNLIAGLATVVILHDMDVKSDHLRALRENISSLNSKPTRLAQPVSVMEWRMFKQLWQACIIGAFLGAFLSFIWARFGKIRIK